MATTYSILPERRTKSDCFVAFRIKQIIENLTSKGTKGASMAPNLAQVEDAPTPQLLMTVGIISAV